MVDPYGRVIARLGLNRTGVLDSPLPAALEGRTLYARLGDGLFFILLALGAAAVAGQAIRQKPGDSPKHDSPKHN